MEWHGPRISKSRKARCKVAKAKLGSGKRFAALKSKLAKQKDVYDPAALAAAIGRKKYGPMKFHKMSAKKMSGKKCKKKPCM